LLAGADVEAQVADRRVVGVGEEVDVPAGQFLRCPSGQGAHHRVRDEHVPVEADEGLGDGCGEEEGLEELAAVGEEGVDGPHATAGGDTGCSGGGPRHLGGGKAHRHRVTHRSGKVTEPGHGES
jgi:hypothetical protein